MRLSIIGVTALLVLAGCTDDEPAPAESAPELFVACGEASFRDQLPSFQRTDQDSPRLDALLGRFFDENRRPCVDVSYDVPMGWTFDHYTIEYDTWLYHETFTKKKDDGPDPFLRAETDDCARYSAEIVLRRGDQTARYTARTRMGPVCTPADG